jgi:hypothetical protein
MEVSKLNLLDYIRFALLNGSLEASLEASLKVNYTYRLDGKGRRNRVC